MNTQNLFPNSIQERLLHFLVPMSADAENTFIYECALAYEGMEELSKFYFNRSRQKDGSTGISLHFSDPDSAKDFIAILSNRFQKNPNQPLFLPIISDEDRMVGDVFGGIDSTLMYRSFSEKTTPILLGWVKQCEKSPQQHRAVAAEVMINYLYFVQKMFKELGRNLRATPYPTTFVSYQSHYEAFASTSHTPSTVRNQFARRYSAVASNLDKVIARYEQNGIEMATPVWMTSWFDLLKERFIWAFNAVNEERLITSSPEILISDRNLLASSFHRKMLKSKEFKRYAMRNPLFQCNRIILGLIYLTLFRLGLPMVERYFLCYAISRAIENYYGVTAEAAFSQGMRWSRIQRWFRIVKFWG